MKHAYLILAHNEFAVLQRLIRALDDVRNDIFIHFDKKVSCLPELKTNKSNLYLLDDRIDIRWGDVSVVEGEYALFEAALKKGRYNYYHLLSGVDMPLRSQNEIYNFFEKHKGKEFIGFSNGDLSSQLDRKVMRYHFFPKHFRANKDIITILRKTTRYVAIHMQILLGIKRNTHISLKKGTQWVSITHDFVTYVLQHKKQVLKAYSHTFCSDEIFLQTLCWNSSFKENVFDFLDESHGCARKIGWQNNELVDWHNEDYDRLIKSDAMFARKFNSENIDVVDRLLKNIKSEVKE